MQKSIIILSLFAVFLFSCKKNNDTGFSFDVSTSKTTYNIGDTVIFKFTGNPDIITFYSGEAGYKYANANRASANGTAQLSFQSTIANNNTNTSLKMFYSTDFTGVYDSVNVAKATWTDITNRAVLATSATTVSSGIIDMSDIAAFNKPVYVGFRYTASAANIQGQWTIKNILLNNVLPDITFPVFSSMTSSTSFAVPQTDFAQVNFKNPAVVWVPTATQFTIAGGPLGTADNDDWVISSALNLNRAVPDLGVPLKNNTTTLSSYSYVFTKAGTYTVTFRAQNNTVNGNAEVIKEFVITVK